MGTLSARRQWAALAVLLLPVLLITVDMTVLGFAIPYLAEDLEPTSAQQLWIVDIYSFMLAGLLVLMGTIGDRIGRRRLLLAGAFAFGAASILAAFAPNAILLIVARAVLGIGGATLMPSTLALIRTIFTDDAQRRTAIAIWSATFSAGMALGPVLGGWLLEHFWWGSVFLINVPVMGLLLVAGRLLLPETRDPNPGRFDPLSAVLSLATMLPVVYGIKQFAVHGPTVNALAGLVIGVVFGVLFVHRQRHLSDPMLDLALFREKKFSISIVTNLCSVFSLVGLLFLTPQYLQLVLGLDSFEAGLWMLPATVSGIAGALISARLANHFRPGTIMCAGMFIGAAGFLVLSMIGVGSGLAVLVIGFLLVGGGVSLAETLTNDLIITAAPPERAGAASAISETGYELGGAMGLALLGSIATAVYRAGLPADAPAAARDTLGGAAALANQRPELFDTARAAFTHGTHVAAWVGAAMLAYTGVQAWFLLGRRGKVAVAAR